MVKAWGNADVPFIAPSPSALGTFWANRGGLAIICHIALRATVIGNIPKFLALAGIR